MTEEPKLSLEVSEAAMRMLIADTEEWFADKDNNGPARYLLQRWLGLRLLMPGGPDAAPAPRVFFPGDTVPAGMWGTNQDGEVLETPADWLLRQDTVVEVHVPTRAEWQAAVDRALAERRQQEQAHQAALCADLGADIAREHGVLPDEDEAADHA